jgi:hypothetical protein
LQKANSLEQHRVDILLKLGKGFLLLESEEAAE